MLEHDRPPDPPNPKLSMGPQNESYVYTLAPKVDITCFQILQAPKQVFLIHVEP